MNNNFKSEIKIRRPSQRLLEKMNHYEKGIIADDLTEEDIDEIIEIYNKETQYYTEKSKRLNLELENLKNEIAEMLKEMKNNNK